MNNRLSDKIADELRVAIVSGKIKDNTFLVEGEIAAQYGVSKAPVKAALALLTQEGYLTSFPRKGYMVSPISVEEYNHIRELRAHIERLSVILAIQRASDEEIKSLRDYTGSKPGEHNPFQTNNTKFHLRLAKLSRNPYIGETLLNLLGQTSRYAIQTNVDDSFHEDIVVAMLERDTNKALDILDKDLDPESPKYRF